ncbi:hypothetical protein NPIL_370051 [Nephila pilipes]|uniref:Uncharacterized protein n=1 Tax=Nephila pilipes TaxID=299642 RepID=A0A8X6N5C2_NEPPI|nr:hypothetical protein NPIL_370051 [Nephila pilipes]
MRMRIALNSKRKRMEEWGRKRKEGEDKIGLMFGGESEDHVQTDLSCLQQIERNITAWDEHVFIRSLKHKK